MRGRQVINERMVEIETGLMGGLCSSVEDIEASFRSCYRWASLSECEASVSPSHNDWLSSLPLGLMEPEEIDDEEPMVHSSASLWRPGVRSAKA